LQNSLAAIAKPVIPSMPSRCKFLSIYAMDVKSIITCHLISLQIPGVPLCLVHCLLVGPHARNQSNLVALIRPESTQREPPLPSQVPVPPALAHRSHWPDIPHAAIVSQSSGCPPFLRPPSFLRSRRPNLRSCRSAAPPLVGHAGARLALGRVSS
jgi:hypothetical protein